MNAFQITDIKTFMNLLFLRETFDAFHLSEATFITFGSFHIDGHFRQDYYSAEELEEQHMGDQPYASWRQMRPFCLELVRGKHTPLEFRIVFRLSPSNTEKLLAQSQLQLAPSDIDGLFLNLHYRAGSLTCTTGTSLRFFTMDKSLDHVWDGMVRKFFLRENIAFES